MKSGWSFLVLTMVMAIMGQCLGGGNGGDPDPANTNTPFLNNPLRAQTILQP